MKKFLPVKSINITSRKLEAVKASKHRHSLNLEYRLKNAVYLLTMLVIIAWILVR